MGKRKNKRDQTGQREANIFDEDGGGKEQAELPPGVEAGDFEIVQSATDYEGSDDTMKIVAAVPPSGLEDDPPFLELFYGESAIIGRGMLGMAAYGTMHREHVKVAWVQATGKNLKPASAPEPEPQAANELTAGAMGTGKMANLLKNSIAKVVEAQQKAQMLVQTVGTNPAYLQRYGGFGLPIIIPVEKAPQWTTMKDGDVVYMGRPVREDGTALNTAFKVHKIIGGAIDDDDLDSEGSPRKIQRVKPASDANKIAGLWPLSRLWFKRGIEDLLYGDGTGGVGRMVKCFWPFTLQAIFVLLLGVPSFGLKDQTTNVWMAFIFTSIIAVWVVKNSIKNERAHKVFLYAYVYMCFLTMVPSTLMSKADTAAALFKGTQFEAEFTENPGLLSGLGVAVFIMGLWALGWFYLWYTAELYSQIETKQRLNFMPPSPLLRIKLLTVGFECYNYCGFSFFPALPWSAMEVPEESPVRPEDAMTLGYLNFDAPEMKYGVFAGACLTVILAPGLLYLTKHDTEKYLIVVQIFYEALSFPIITQLVNVFSCTGVKVGKDDGYGTMKQVCQLDHGEVGDGYNNNLQCMDAEPSTVCWGTSHFTGFLLPVMVLLLPYYIMVLHLMATTQSKQSVVTIDGVNGIVAFQVRVILAVLSATVGECYPVAMVIAIEICVGLLFLVSVSRDFSSVLSMNAIRRAGLGCASANGFFASYIVWIYRDKPLSEPPCAVGYTITAEMYANGSRVRPLGFNGSGSWESAYNWSSTNWTDLDNIWGVSDGEEEINCNIFTDAESCDDVSVCAWEANAYAKPICIPNPELSGQLDYNTFYLLLGTNVTVLVWGISWYVRMLKKGLWEPVEEYENVINTTEGKDLMQLINKEGPMDGAWDPTDVDYPVVCRRLKAVRKTLQEIRIRDQERMHMEVELACKAVLGPQVKSEGGGLMSPRSPGGSSLSVVDDDSKRSMDQGLTNTAPTAATAAAEAEGKERAAWESKSEFEKRGGLLRCIAPKGITVSRRRGITAKNMVSIPGTAIPDIRYGEDVKIIEIERSKSGALARLRTPRGWITYNDKENGNARNFVPASKPFCRLQMSAMLDPMTRELNIKLIQMNGVMSELDLNGDGSTIHNSFWFQVELCDDDGNRLLETAVNQRHEYRTKAMFDSSGAMQPHDTTPNLECKIKAGATISYMIVRCYNAVLLFGDDIASSMKLEGQVNVPLEFFGQHHGLEPWTSKKVWVQMHQDSTGAAITPGLPPLPAEAVLPGRDEDHFMRDVLVNDDGTSLDDAERRAYKQTLKVIRENLSHRLRKVEFDVQALYEASTSSGASAEPADKVAKVKELEGAKYSVKVERMQSVNNIPMTSTIAAEKNLLQILDEARLNGGPKEMKVKDVYFKMHVSEESKDAIKASMDILDGQQMEGATLNMVLANPAWDMSVAIPGKELIGMNIDLREISTTYEGGLRILLALRKVHDGSTKFPKNKLPNIVKDMLGMAPPAANVRSLHLTGMLPGQFKKFGGCIASKYLGIKKLSMSDVSLDPHKDDSSSEDSDDDEKAVGVFKLFSESVAESELQKLDMVSTGVRGDRDGQRYTLDTSHSVTRLRRKNLGPRDAIIINAWFERSIEVVRTQTTALDITGNPLCDYGADLLMRLFQSAEGAHLQTMLGLPKTADAYDLSGQNMDPSQGRMLAAEMIDSRKSPNLITIILDDNGIFGSCDFEDSTEVGPGNLKPESKPASGLESPEITTAHQVRQGPMVHINPFTGKSSSKTPRAGAPFQRGGDRYSVRVPTRMPDQFLAMSKNLQYAFTATSTLQSLSLRCTGIGPEMCAGDNPEAGNLRDTFLAMSNLTEVNVASNRIELRGAEALLTVYRERANLKTLLGIKEGTTELDYGHQDIEVGVAYILAEELMSDRVCGAVTSINLLGCPIGGQEFGNGFGRSSIDNTGVDALIEVFNSTPRIQTMFGLANDMQVVDFSNSNVDSAQCRLLAEDLKAKRGSAGLMRLNLSGNMVGVEGATAMVQAYKKRVTLTTMLGLDPHYAEIGRPPMTEIDLRGMGLDSGCAMMLGAELISHRLCDHVKVVNISDNMIFGRQRGLHGDLSNVLVHAVDKDQEGWQSLCESVRISNIEELIARNVGLGPKGILAIADSLSEGILRLDISNNYIFGHHTTTRKIIFTPPRSEARSDDVVVDLVRTVDGIGDSHMMVQKAWARFCEVGIRNAPNLRSFRARSIGMGPQGLQTLASYMGDKVASIDLSANYLFGAVEDPKARTDIYRHKHRHRHKIDGEGDPSNFKGWRQICSDITEGKIEEFLAEDVGMGPVGAAILTDALNAPECKLVRLNIMGNQLADKKTDCSEQFIDLLNNPSRLPPLQTLVGMEDGAEYVDLSWRKLDDASARVLCAELSVARGDCASRNITALNLLGNCLTGAGVKLIEQTAVMKAQINSVCGIRDMGQTCHSWANSDLQAADIQLIAVDMIIGRHFSTIEAIDISGNFFFGSKRVAKTLKQIEKENKKRKKELEKKRKKAAKDAKAAASLPVQIVEEIVNRVDVLGVSGIATKREEEKADKERVEGSKAHTVALAAIRRIPKSAARAFAAIAYTFDGVAALSDELEAGTSLVHLHQPNESTWSEFCRAFTKSNVTAIRTNDIGMGMEAASRFAVALLENKSGMDASQVTHIEMSRNPIGNHGREAMEQAVQEYERLVKPLQVTVSPRQEDRPDITWLANVNTQGTDEADYLPTQKSLGALELLDELSKQAEATAQGKVLQTGYAQVTTRAKQFTGSHTKGFVTTPRSAANGQRGGIHASVSATPRPSEPLEPIPEPEPADAEMAEVTNGGVGAVAEGPPPGLSKKELKAWEKKNGVKKSKRTKSKEAKRTPSPAMDDFQNPLAGGEQMWGDSDYVEEV